MKKGQLPCWLPGSEGVRLSPTEERVWREVGFVSTREREEVVSFWVLATREEKGCSIGRQRADEQGLNTPAVASLKHPVLLLVSSSCCARRAALGSSQSSEFSSRWSIWRVFTLLRSIVGLCYLASITTASLCPWCDCSQTTAATMTIALARRR